MAQGSAEFEDLEVNAAISPVVHTQSSEFSLSPIDKGKEAWLFLAASWVIQALVFGFGFSFGVFQDYYTTHEPFASSENISVIGTTTMGVMYIGAPFIILLCNHYPRWGRWSTLIGLLIASLSMAMCSFCNSVSQLIGTQGIAFGVGGCLAYCPCAIYINEWFAERKGMAYGLVWSATGLGGAVLPLLLQALLDNLGFQTATRVWAGILLICSAPLAFFIKPRLPYSASVYRRSLNIRHITSRISVLHQMVNIIQAIGYFLPGIYLPTYAHMNFNASPSSSTLTVILVNVSLTIGCVIMGSLTDNIHVTTCMLISAIGSASSVLAMWGFAESLPVLYVFCVLYGLFAGCWTALWPGIMRDVSQRGRVDGGFVDPMTVYGYLCVGRGIGNIISGPLSHALTKGMMWQGEAIAGYGSGYGMLIIFTGLTCLLSGMNFLWKHLGML